MFDPITLKLSVDPLILSALKEDVTSEDVTTNSVMREACMGQVDLICKEDGVICGLQVFARAFQLLDENVEVDLLVKDGDQVKKGQLMGTVKGDIRILLVGERTGLNYLQRMSGIATYTNSIAKLLEGSKTKLLDTRKTSPNNRIFEKYSVRVCGGNNHRYILTDGILLKDNHIGAAGSVEKAIQMAKEYAPFVRKGYRRCCSQSSPRWFLPIPWSRSGYSPSRHGSGCPSRSHSSRISDCDFHHNRRYRSRFLPSPAPSGSRFHICSSLPPSPWTSPTPAFPLCRTSWSAPLLGSGTGCQNTPHSRSVHKRRSHGCSSPEFQSSSVQWPERHTAIPSRLN